MPQRFDNNFDIRDKVIAGPKKENENLSRTENHDKDTVRLGISINKVNGKNLKIVTERQMNTYFEYITTLEYCLKAATTKVRVVISQDL